MVKSTRKRQLLFGFTAADSLLERRAMMVTLLVL
jgi:hypothetical protein